MRLYPVCKQNSASYYAQSKTEYSDSCPLSDFLAQLYTHKGNPVLELPWNIIIMYVVISRAYFRGCPSSLQFKVSNVYINV